MDRELQDYCRKRWVEGMAGDHPQVHKRRIPIMLTAIESAFQRSDFFRVTGRAWRKITLTAEQKQQLEAKYNSPEWSVRVAVDNLLDRGGCVNEN